MATEKPVKFIKCLRRLDGELTQNRVAGRGRSPKGPTDLQLSSAKIAQLIEPLHPTLRNLAQILVKLFVDLSYFLVVRFVSYFVLQLDRFEGQKCYVSSLDRFATNT